MKRCSKCKVEKPFEEFSKDRTKKDGYKNQCKSCVKKYYEENKDEICEKQKQYDKENKDKKSKYKKQYREENKDKIYEYQKQYYEENKDKICEQNKQYREENKDKVIEKNSKYRKENKDKIKKYKKENKDKINAFNSKRRAKKLQATPIWLTDEHLKSIERFYSISKEMELISGVKYHVDHIVPLQGDNVCGLHVPWNLQILESSENMSKKNKLLSQDQEFYHQILEFDDLMENIL